MALIDIIKLCASEAGILTADAEEKALLILKINEAAKELYESTDLVDCLREQVFCIDPIEDQISLPWYVGKIRAARGYDTQGRIDLIDMRPRYHHVSWPPERCWNWRQKTFSPLARELSNASLITFSIPIAETEDVTINICGATQNSARIVEEVIIPAGSLLATSVNTFTPGNNAIAIESIRKTVASRYDITIKDAAANILGIIANSELESRYTIIQVMERRGSVSGAVATTSDCAEILYKIRFTPLVNDYDEFVCRGYEHAIFYKFYEHWLSKKPDRAEGALLSHEKSAEIVKLRARDHENGISMPMDFGHNRFHGLIDHFYRGDIYAQR